MPKGICSSCIALVPKRDNPQRVSDYRPISLIGCIYKFISKLLASRLKKVIEKLISDTQLDFVANRQILDGVLIVNELLDLAKKMRDDCLMLKVDFEKAYDSVNWKFFNYLIRGWGFMRNG